MKKLIAVSFAALVATASLSAATLTQATSVKKITTVTVAFGDPSLPDASTGVPPGGSNGPRPK